MRARDTRIASAALSAILLASGDVALAIEEPAYEVVDRVGVAEIRAYAPRLLAETEVEGEFDRAGNQAFRRLAGYIFGDNRARTGTGDRAEIAMTAPVAMRPASEKIAMTAPVAMRPAGDDGSPDRWVMAFAMPSGWSLETLPEPVDRRVTLREAPARQVAVLTFSGLGSARRFAEQERALRELLAGSEWRIDGPAETMRYDPPWTLWFLRRNEVHLPVLPASAGASLPGPQ
jgi:hypothetical protein